MACYRPWMESQRVGHNLATEQQQKQSSTILPGLFFFFLFSEMIKDKQG